VKLLGVAYGVGLLLASAVALLLAAVLLDYLLNLPALPRLVVTLGALGVVGYVLVRYILHPAMSRLTIGDVAGKLETTFPQFDDRLRSTVNFMRGGNPGSDTMQQRVITEARKGHGAAPGIRVVDTIKRADENGNVIETISREGLWRIQTPQAFPREMLEKAYADAHDAGVAATDDASLLERLGQPVVIVPGSARAMKITTDSDFARAEALTILPE